MPERYRDYIRSNHEFLCEGDRHVLVSEETIDCCEQVSYSALKNLILSDPEWELVFVEWMRKNHEAGWYPDEVAESDFIRFFYARKSGWPYYGFVYADCDVLFKEPIPELDENYSWFGLDKGINHLDIFLFIDFGTNGLISDFMETLKNKNTPMNHPVGSAAVSFLSNDSRVKILNDSFFVHEK